MFIKGIGKTKFGILKKSALELAAEAASSCLADANTSIKDVDVLIVSNFIGGPQNAQLHLNSALASILGFTKTSMRIEAACASGGMAIHTALRSSVKNVLVVGTERMNDRDIRETTRNIGMAGDFKLDQQPGLIFPAAYALIAQQHMLRFGTTLDDLSLVSFKNHQNVMNNPLGHFSYKKVTKEMIDTSIKVCTPLRLFDCSPLSDGAAAILLSTEPDNHRICITGSGAASDTISLAQRKDLTSFRATKDAARIALGAASKRISDMNLVEVHDCFTIAELVAMEDLGICKPGESAAFVREGKSAITGTMPVNPDGGLKAAGHPIGATGVSQIVELATQLRNAAGTRQVPNARFGLALNVGGVGGTAVVHILERM